MQVKHRTARLLIALSLVCSFLLPAAPAALAQDTATIHYFRPDGEYAGWGLHAWDDAAVTVEWGSPLEPAGEDDRRVATWAATRSSSRQSAYKPPQALNAQSTARSAPASSTMNVGPLSRIQASLYASGTTATDCGRRARAA